MRKSNPLSPEELSSIKLFGAKDRPAEVVTNLSSLDDEQVNFETYTLQEGDKFEVESFDTLAGKVIKQPVRAAREGEDASRIGKVILVPGRLTRKDKTYPTYFNLNSLTKRDADNQPVMPFWYELGNAGARLKKLCEIGTVTVKKVETVKVAAFDNRTGMRVKTPVTKDGVTVLVDGTRDQKVGIVVAAD